MAELKDIKKILVINLGGIGDVLISTPALRAIKGRFPGAELFLMVVDRAAEVVRDLAYVDRVFVWDIRRPWRNLPGNLKAIFELRRARLDLGINMRTLVSGTSAGKIKFILGLIKPRLKAGRDTSGRGDFFDIKVPESDIGDKYEMEYDLDIAEALGAKIPDKRIDFVIGPASLEQAERLLLEGGIQGSDVLIGIHPGGKPSHRWPEDRFVQVMKRLREETGCKFVITGAKDEVELASRLRNDSGAEVLDLAGKAGIKLLAAVLRKCALYITNDTGTMHIAAIAGTPLVAIFGPGYFKRYDPANISVKTVSLYNNSGCSPCNKEECDSLKCLESVTAQDVVAAAKSLLAAGKRT